MIPNGDGLSCSQCPKKYEKKHQVWQCFASNLSELSKDEIHYHDHLRDDDVEVHQLNAYRNNFFHNKVWNYIRRVPKSGLLLEIGAGIGYDAKNFVSDYSLTVLDISTNSLEHFLEHITTPVVAVAADGACLPFVDGSFDGVYTIATFHHMEDYAKSMHELWRVLKPGGRLVIGIEPNAFYFKMIKKVRGLLCHATHTDAHEGSHADAEMTGFTEKQFYMLLSGDGWKNVSIEPMWFLTGLLHYKLEFLYRALKLKKRIILPVWLEKGIVGLDSLLFKIPGVKHLCWHWIVTAKKMGT